MSKVVGNAFQWWAEEVVCKFPKITLLIVFVFVAVCCAGFPQTEFTTDPVELWVDPNSQVYKELDYYSWVFLKMSYFEVKQGHLRSFLAKKRDSFIVLDRTMLF